MKRVSIGLPVYNGERFIRDAIESIRAQTYDDFELILSDNGSTDGTPGICREYAAKDARVRYFPNRVNRGAAWNFNRCFALGSGEYFKWMAHDDMCAPNYLARCVEALDHDPDAVLACPWAQVIDADSIAVETCRETFPADSANPAERFASMLGGHKCFQVFGLMRRSVLAQTRLIGAYPAGDNVLLAELALRGPFREIPEVLFFPRRHPEQSMSMVGDFHRYAAWFDPSLDGRLVFPFWRRAREYLRCIHRVRLGGAVRLDCYRRLFRWIREARGRLRGELTHPLRCAVRRRWGFELPRVKRKI